MTSVFKNIINYFVKSIYTDDCLLIYHSSKNTNFQLRNDLKIVKADVNNISALRAFEKIEKIEWLKSKLLKNQDGYMSYHNGTCCHRSWVCKGPLEIKIHYLCSFKIQANEVLIQYCETSHLFRGIGIYPYTLKYIQNCYKNKQCLIVVEKSNIPSIRGIEKAGYVYSYSLKIKSILFFTYIKKLDENINSC